MRATVGAVGLAAPAQTAPGARAKDIRAGPLFSICSTTPATDKVRDGLCDAYPAGLVTDLRRAGAVCPPEEAHREVRRTFIGLALGDVRRPARR